MGHSSLLGTDRAAVVPDGRDVATLGPGDSSDSGSDMMGIDDGDGADPGLPVDVAMRDDNPHPLMPSADVVGSTGGTGERRSAGSDAGLHDAADIGVDRVFTPGKGPDALADDEDADLAFMDDLATADPLDDDDAIDDASDIDGVERERMIAGPRSGDAVAQVPNPVPGQPNPAPDVPVEPPDDDDLDPPADPDADAGGDRRRQPDRVAALLRPRR